MSKFNKVGQFLPSRFCIISTNFTRINAFPIIRSISLSNANILVVISFRINTNFIQFIFFFFSVSPAKFAYNVSFTSFYLILIHFMEMYIRLQNKYHQPTKTNHASIDSLVERYIRGNVLRSNWSTFELTMRKNKL